ncbi:putative oxidoreductase [Rhodotorula diobovata]|uniref:Putative oxidoreductase n=1 Tax=Rhodotorula diobovata TaxID=5288 RepID=A0A5C5FTH1_9BASI|nr:putative oxidoreductase [Rhodotorula diobovata]
MATNFPKAAPPLVGRTHHDVYADIDPADALADAAKGLCVLVTGAGRGVGRAEAIAFAQAGAKKVVLTSRSKDELDEVKAAIDALGKGTDVVIHTADITDEKSVDELFETAGEVDALINNAGYLEPCVSIREGNPSDWARSIDINLKGTHLATRAFLRSAEKSGRLDPDRASRPEHADKVGLTVINTSSVGSAGTRPGFSGYQPAKSMVNRFTEFLHFEEPLVRTFSMHPGGVMTKLARESMPPDTHGLLTDKAELAGGFSVWLATQSKADFLRGRYVSANWDVNELVKKAPEVIERDLLWTRVVGQEQVMPKTSQVHLY